jgi:SP family myo-inositol transporter-like MFS transporter 13
MVVPLYISELAPAKYRGRMIAFNNMSVTFGQFLASSIGAGFAQVGGESSQAWRATVGIGAAPAIILAGLLTLCPESPRQLVAHGKVDEASVVLTRIYPTSTEEQRRAKISSIEMSINEATQTMVDDSVFKTLARIFTTPSTFRAVFTACTIMAISQLSGFNTLMYYSATLFKIVGFNNATAVAITVSATNFVFSLLNLIIVDKFGRRRILLVTILGMSVCLIIAAVSFSFIPINLRTLEVQSEEIGWPGFVLIATIIIFVGFYSSGVATVAWIGTGKSSKYYRPIEHLLTVRRTYPNGSPRRRHNVEYCHVLEHQHHHCVYLLEYDEGHYAIRCFWVLRRYLLLWVAVRHLLLPGGQGNAARSDSRGV